MSVGGNISCQLPKNKAFYIFSRKQAFLLLKLNRNILVKILISSFFERHEDELSKDSINPLQTRV